MSKKSHNKRKQPQYSREESERRAAVKAAFADEVTALIERNIADRSERMLAVQAVTDAYIDSMDGELPDPAHLERLTDYVLREELTDRHPDKVTREEYPFMSQRQLERRRFTQIPIHWLDDKLDTDGNEYKSLKRRKRSVYEMVWVDKHAKIRNKERAAQYRKDISAGPIVPYNLRDTGGELLPEFTQCNGVGERWRESLSIVY
jgi:hypothetical protein